MALTLPPLPVPTVTPSPTAITGETVAEIAKAAAPEAIRILYDIANDREEKGATRVAAANAIIDRAEGKVGIVQDNSVNYTVIINQINRVRGRPTTSTDVTPSTYDEPM